MSIIHECKFDCLLSFCMITNVIGDSYHDHDMVVHTDDYCVQTSSNPRVYHVTAYGADPTSQTDSTDAILRAISDAFRAPDNRQLINGIPDLGGAEVHLDGGSYKISRPLRLPASGGGNLQVHHALPKYRDISTSSTRNWTSY